MGAQDAPSHLRTAPPSPTAKTSSAARPHTASSDRRVPLSCSLQLDPSHRQMLPRKPTAKTSSGRAPHAASSGLPSPGRCVVHPWPS